MTDTKGFRAIFKQRYSDFHVHEVDPEGTVLHLTSLQLPSKQPEHRAVEEREQQGRAALLELVGEDETDKFIAWLDQGRKDMAARNEYQQKKAEQQRKKREQYEKEREQEGKKVFEARMEERRRFLAKEPTAKVSKSPTQADQKQEAQSTEKEVTKSGEAETVEAESEEQTATQQEQSKEEEKGEAATQKQQSEEVATQQEKSKEEKGEAAEEETSKEEELPSRPPPAPFPFEFEQTGSLDKAQRGQLHDILRTFWTHDQLHTYTAQVNKRKSLKEKQEKEEQRQARKRARQEEAKQKERGGTAEGEDSESQPKLKKQKVDSEANTAEQPPDKADAMMTDVEPSGKAIAAEQHDVKTGSETDGTRTAKQLQREKEDGATDKQEDKQQEAGKQEQKQQEIIPNIQVQFQQLVGRIENRWPAVRPDFLRCLLHKENWDTLSAVDALCRQLRLPGKCFSYAGTKDRRAITTQALHIKRLPAQRLVEAVHRLKGIKVGNMSYVPAPLKLGQLSGNRFRIILRKCQAQQEDIQAAITQLEQHGFINYYGMQRFGTCDVPTSLIGRAVLRGDFNQAVALLLLPPQHRDKKQEEEKKYTEGNKEEAEHKKQEEGREKDTQEGEGKKMEQQEEQGEKGQKQMEEGEGGEQPESEDNKDKEQDGEKEQQDEGEKHEQEEEEGGGDKQEKAEEERGGDKKDKKERGEGDKKKDTKDSRQDRDKYATREREDALGYFKRTRDAEGALGKLAPYMHVERKVLTVLAKRNHHNAFQQAFETLPRGRRLLYAHAFQSQVWNELASLRIQQLGTQVVVGDLVLRPKQNKRTTQEADKEAHKLSKSTQQTDTDNDADVLDLHGGDEAEDSGLWGEDEDSEEKGPHGGLSVEALLKRLETAVVEVTAEDVANNRYSIEDVVLPLPGYGVVLPANVMATHYAQILQREGVRFALPPKQQKKKEQEQAEEKGAEGETSKVGDGQAMETEKEAGGGQAIETEEAGEAQAMETEEVGAVQAIQTEETGHEGNKQKAEATDVRSRHVQEEQDTAKEDQVLCNTSKDYVLPGSYRRLVVKPIDVSHRLLRYNDFKVPLLLTDIDRLKGKEEPTSLEGGSDTALQIEFTLPLGTYATMCLREVLKESTTKAHQTGLNDSL
eukprot:gb/GEZN01000615.1/.p1 GENE.gb/GEZN01000615.1/~~gb/GEZN01000615.1/.p1  ORF type:complete len:1198 (+),score=416.51 gb/GEZN01000615.1/:189-3596(+)